MTSASLPEGSRRDNLLVVTVFVAALSLVVAAVGVGFGWRAIDQTKGTGTSVAAGNASAPAMVDLKEFKIDDATVPQGGSIMAMNAGSVTHNLTIEGQGLATKNLDAGGTEVLDVSKLKPGTYTMYCSIPGHREAGMQAKLTITGGGSSAAASSSSSSSATMDYAAMTKSMLDSMTAFPAKTEGVGNQPLAPTKVKGNEKWFDITAAITKWEVSPGKTVDAWTFNGTVPGPQIRVNVGDKVHLTLHNKTPMATDLHLHGINVDNKYDGVSPFTQDPIKPGDSFEYVWTADEPAVAMYHPHFMSQVSMPNGMFGTIIQGDMPLPAEYQGVQIAQHFPMVLNDSGVIGYSLNGKSFPATAPIVANKGDWILVDYFNEGSQYHPMHMHQFDQIVIAKDGFPVPAPYKVDTLSVGPGERYTVLVHLDKVGTWVWHCHILPHVEKDDGMYGMVTAVIVK
ncbi:MAG TPA: multicopper oxidase domain-containing protein [Acidimicrobiales bacterium]|nr:multicopper oxidase domain-containing protein [Acidimicrobiales bacterium]